MKAIKNQGLILIIMVSAFLTGCTSGAIPSIQDSIFTAASLIEQAASSAQTAYEGGSLDRDTALEISDKLFQAGDYVRLAKQSFLENDMSGAMAQLTSALQFLEQAKLMEIVENDGN